MYFPSKLKQPGTKSIVTVDNDGNQIKLDAYAYRWQKRIHNRLKQICTKASSYSIQTPQIKEIQTLLSDWIIVTANMTLDEIHSLINCEINNSSSILKEKSSFSFFSYHPVFGQVSALLDEIKDVIQATQTPQTITKAGIANSF